MRRPISASTVVLLLSISFGTVAVSGKRCGFPGAPAHSIVEFSTPTVEPGTVARYTCDRGFELLGPARRMCNTNGTWVPQGIPFCVLNVAAGKAPMQSSVSEGGIPQKAVDGSTSTFFDGSTCTLTEVERSPWWYVNLLEPYMVQLVRIDFGQSCCAKGRTATIVVRVGNNRPDLGVNPICNRFSGSLEEGRPLFLPCNPPMPGAFVSVHFEGPPGVSLSICETFVYTDQALPVERCPTFRDQPPGSTATYNGKCYIFYNQQPVDFQTALEFCESRGGSLVDESNPALQGFLSWELWRRHKGDANGQYWMGAVRDLEDAKSWKWINGNPVSVSFWNLPGGNDNCARFDGTKGWLWSDTNCGLNLNFICQHRPTTCGKPEQPPNSTLIAHKFNVGSRIEYACDEGHLLVGPSQRSCLSTGFYSEFPPVCRFLECGMPAEVEHATLTFLNASSNPRGFRSYVSYDCEPGYVAVGRTDLMCDVDERWNGPPPRCDPVYCPEPEPVRHGGLSLSTNSTAFGTVLTYYCTSQRHHVLIGRPKLVCQADGTWDGRVPVCKPRDRKGALDALLEMQSGGSRLPLEESPPEGRSSSRASSSSDLLPEDFRPTPPALVSRPYPVPKAQLPDDDPEYMDEFLSIKVTPPASTSTGGLRTKATSTLTSTSTSAKTVPTVPTVPTTVKTTSTTVTTTTAFPALVPRSSVVPEDLNSARFPIDNEIPDSANVQANPGPGADVPLSVQNSMGNNGFGGPQQQQQLNLGGIIALGVFGGFVFLAAIITTIIILIRRKEPRQMEHRRHRDSSSGGHSSGTESGDSIATSSGGGGHIGRFRSRMDSEELRDATEVVVHSYAKPEKKSHHHHHHHHHQRHHHHRHKHREPRDRSSSESRHHGSRT